MTDLPPDLVRYIQENGVKVETVGDLVRAFKMWRELNGKEATAKCAGH